jgi:segregation and condensation protein B
MKDQLRPIIESLIFISLEPLSLEKLKSVLQDFPQEEVELALQELLKSNESNERGIQIIQSGGGYLFATKPAYDPWVKRLLNIERKTKLSQASLETLSIIAYHQPITQAEISALRGVDSTYTLKTLLQKKLTKIVGRKKAPGKPLIYRTSEKFLLYFGLNSLDDLPSEEEILSILEHEKFSEE